jgi:hypothetical protein
MRRELGIHGLQLSPPFSSVNWAEGSPGVDSGSAVGWLSFRRIVDIPFDACLAALESWQRTAQDGELHFGRGLVRGPMERDRDSGTCRIQVRLDRGPLRLPLRMRLDIDRLSSSGTALELIPGQRTRPTAGYFRAGHCLLDSLTRALLVYARNAARTTSEGQHHAIHGLLRREVLSDQTPKFGEEPAGSLDWKATNQPRVRLQTIAEEISCK